VSVKPFGLYVHIPFCSRLCHYCDFAKTANYTAEHVTEYISALRSQLLEWNRLLEDGNKFSSVFFGGGTPGVLSSEYESLMELIHNLILPGAEITLESNPANVTVDNIRTWKSLGFNRLSVGIQSFDTQGIKTLTSHHTSEEALRALTLAAKHFAKSNGDLIYGWPGQTVSSWDRDLDSMLSTGVNHLSLYALTYEGHTPFARAERRGAMQSASGDELAGYYERACEVLGQNGFDHEEISNWSLPSGGCDHNWLYWRSDYFVGIGAGAHGFIDDGSAIGLRYSYPGDLRQFLRSARSQKVNLERSPSSIIGATGGIIDKDRDKQSWLLEYVGCALRSKEGVDLELIGRCGFSFVPNAKINRAIAEGLLICSNNRLFATEPEWFRETAWSFEICESLN
jgi:oxygen-independent coproporphyrinogen-3 oxidase